MPFYYGKRSADICIVPDPKKSSTYCSEYASGFLEPAALHLPASRGEAAASEGDEEGYQPPFSAAKLRSTRDIVRS
jgi:hypothetical protein